MSKLSPIYDLLRSDAFITVNKLLSLAIGVNESNLFSELLSRHNYFDEREMLTDEGYFFNTIDDLYLGTGLSAYQQRLAIKNLVALGLIDSQVRGLPPTRYFRINQDDEVIRELLKNGRQITRKVRYNQKNEETSFFKVKKLHGNKNNISASATRSKPVDPDTPLVGVKPGDMEAMTARLHIAKRPKNGNGKGVENG